MDRALITGLIVSCFGLHFALAQGGKEYFKVGNDIELRPPGTDKITQVLWKHNENLVAEWSKDSEVDYYSTFKGRTHLDTNTGVLVISSTTENDGGTYKVEINDRLLDVEYEVALIQEVPKPTVWVKPGVTDEERTLDCGGEVSKAAPVEYFWDIGPNENEPWVMFVERKITWKNNETTQMIQKLSCKMKNPLGEKSSDSVDNPFYSNNTTTLMAGVVTALILIVIVIIVVVVCLKCDAIKSRFFNSGGRTTGNGAVSPEEHGLNSPTKP